MRHGSLFSGIGGFDLAAEWMGWENIFHCEWMPFPRKVLKYYWPKSISYENICTTDFSVHRGNIDILTGGFPCQPYSTAGKRLGKADERHLFPHMLRAIKEIQPRWVIGENVRGLVSWNGGMVFDEVCTDLESEGYEVQPFLIPAASVNAPHQRQRIWFVAYANNKGGSDGFGQVQATNGEISERNNDAEFSDTSKLNAADSMCNGYDEKYTKKNNIIREDCQQSGTQRISTIKGFSNEWNATNSENIRRENALENGELEGRRFGQSYQRNAWDSFPSVSPICNGDDGLSSRLDSITFPKWRNESIKGGGNAIVPQVAYQIFKVIEQLKQRQ